MNNYFSSVIGATLSVTPNGLRNSLTGRFISLKDFNSMRQVGVITHGAPLDAIEDAQIRGLNVLVSADGSYASLYAPLAKK